MNRLLCTTTPLLVVGVLMAGCAHRHPIRPPWAKPLTVPYVCPAADPECGVFVSVEFNETTRKCELSVSDDEVEVLPAKQPFLVWTLRPKNANYDYQFHRTNGIVFKTSITDDDFKDPLRRGPDKFSWKSVNKRPGKNPFDYGVNVQRRVPPNGPWMDCDVLDPRIVNDGP